MVVAAVAFVDVDAAGFDPGQRRPTRQLRPQSVAVEGIAAPCLAAQIGRPGLGGRGVAADTLQRTHKEPWLALAGTFDLRKVQRIDLAAGSVLVAVKPP
jgi:hypothetical protein